MSPRLVLAILKKSELEDRRKELNLPWMLETFFSARHLLERALSVFCVVLSSVACRFLGSFDGAFPLPRSLLERRPWSAGFIPADWYNVPKSVAASRLLLPLLPPDRVNILMGLSSLE